MVFRALVPGLAGLSIATATFAGDCVSAAQMQAGISLDYKDGGRVEVRRIGKGLVELREIGTAAGGGDLRFVSQYGLYDLEAGASDKGATDPDRQVRYDYQGQPLIEPRHGGTGWTGKVIVTFPGGESEVQTAAYVFGAESRLALGDCSYRILSIDATFLRDGGWEGQKLAYFRDLGFAMLVARSGGGDERTDYELQSLAAVQ